MGKVFERGTEKDRDIILMGTVAKIKDGTSSKTGNKYAVLTLNITEFDEEMELEVDSQVDILFVDSDGGEYGPQPRAEKFLALKAKEGTRLMVRATVVSKDGEEPSYFGIRAYYPGTAITLKQSRKGLGATIVYGTMLPKEDKNIVTIPVRMWDPKKKENYTVWYNLTGPNDEISPEDMAKISELTENGKHKIGAFVCDTFSLKETKENDVVTSVSGSYNSLDC